MALAVLSPQPLDVLEAQVREKFSAITPTPLAAGSNGNLPQPPPNSNPPEPPQATFQNPFPPVKPGSGDEPVFPLIRVIPLRDKRVVDFSFPMPPTRSLYRSAPTE